MEEMAVSTRQFVPANVAKKVSPIQYLTENGFSITRPGDRNGSISVGGTTHEFLVRDRHGYELQITVQISSGPVAEVLHRCRGRISSESSYWIALAERHLANHLWEADDYPPDARLTVDELTIGDIDLARRWGCKT